MSDVDATVALPPVRESRNPGLKFLVVCGLALLMAIPALFVFGLLNERTNRARDVTSELGQVLGGPQVFVGPILALPYSEPAKAPPPGQAQAPAREDVLLVFPGQASARVVERSEVRRRSLFKVPVYRSTLDLDSRFDLAPLALKPGAVVDWSRAEVLVGATEPRGAQADATVRIGAESRPLSPASLLSETALEAPAADGDATLTPGRVVRFFGAPAGAQAAPGRILDVSTRLNFSGARRLAVLGYGRTTTLKVVGDWPHPSFDGAFLPQARAVSAKGFEASWSVPFIARGVPAATLASTLPRLGRAEMGVSFAQPADPYQSVARSLKYALLFVGLVFMTYFIFESLTGVAVHPAQYVLVGLSQIVFYLLLLSIAEHVGFDLAFLLSAGATVALIGAYAGQVFHSRVRGGQALVVFGLLYSGIYVLMRLEDYALLVGALAAFTAIAAVMFFTRRIDWYGAGRSLADAARFAPQSETGER